LLDDEGGYPDPLPGVSAYSSLELVQIRDKATAELALREPLSLRDLDMEQELIVQMHTLKLVQGELLQKGADMVQPTLLNAVTTSIDRLAQRQIQIYSAQRFKLVENTLLRALRSLPEETVREFLDDYEAALKTLNAD
jgi:hypothetical protein